MMGKLGGTFRLPLCELEENNQAALRAELKNLDLI